ncbi:MAG: gliding motility-associated C-terminal domain-containing protein, partial [Eudoraea sp.]|nr:gliding motility-associated C-terminal domain-containing protein [Eudoraea sp.]
MRKFCYLLLVSGLLGHAQTALYNSGNLRIHNEGQIGFHTNLINDGIFDENVGLAGFYGPSNLTVSGALSPVLFDVEIVNTAGVVLNTSLSVANNTSFVAGDFITPR